MNSFPPPKKKKNLSNCLSSQVRLQQLKSLAWKISVAFYLSPAMRDVARYQIKKMISPVALVCSSPCESEWHFPRQPVPCRDPLSSRPEAAIREMPASRWRRMKAIPVHGRAALTSHSHSPGQARPRRARARKHRRCFTEKFRTKNLGSLTEHVTEQPRLRSRPAPFMSQRGVEGGRQGGRGRWGLTLAWPWFIQFVQQFRAACQRQLCWVMQGATHAPGWAHSLIHSLIPSIPSRPWLSSPGAPPGAFPPICCKSAAWDGMKTAPLPLFLS